MVKSCSRHSHAISVNVLFVFNSCVISMSVGVLLPSMNFLEDSGVLWACQSGYYFFYLKHPATTYRFYNVLY